MKHPLRAFMIYAAVGLGIVAIGLMFEGLYRLEKWLGTLPVCVAQTRPGYTPYCGADHCPYHMPRTKFTGTQFKCQCGWRTSFEPEFIEQYRQRNTPSSVGNCEAPNGGCHTTADCPGEECRRTGQCQVA